MDSVWSLIYLALLYELQFVCVKLLVYISIFNVSRDQIVLMRLSVHLSWANSSARERTEETYQLGARERRGKLTDSTCSVSNLLFFFSFFGFPHFIAKNHSAKRTLQLNLAKQCFRQMVRFAHFIAKSDLLYLAKAWIRIY